MATSKSKSKAKTKTAHRRRQGARGYRFGDVWLNSIKDGKGAALRAANKPKLLETASKFGVRGIRATMEPAKIVEKIASTKSFTSAI